MSLDGFSFALEPIQRYITAVLSQGTIVSELSTLRDTRLKALKNTIEHLRNIFNAATVKRIQQALTSGTPSFLQDSDSLLARAILTSGVSSILQRMRCEWLTYPSINRGHTG